MDTSGKINALGRQYIGAAPPSGNAAGTGDSPLVAPALSSVLRPLVVALSVLLLT